MDSDVLLALSYFCASSANSAAGFGFAMFARPLTHAVSAVPPFTSLPVLTAAKLVSNAALYYRYSSFLPRHVMIPLMVGTLATLQVGVYLGQTRPAATALAAGCLMLSYVVYSLCVAPPQRARPLLPSGRGELFVDSDSTAKRARFGRTPWLRAILYGMVAGVAQGATGLTGVALVAFADGEPHWNTLQRRALFQTYFLLSNSALTVSLWWSDAWSLDEAMATLLVVTPATLLGVVAGSTFLLGRRAALAIFAVGGVSLVQAGARRLQQESD
mmetsp:Transcript_16073/g.50249  ORF Transcript_16073/g.50249 Transcript_16073/m.50249 type:complete len:272 (-) Transcript_16073:1023-1838(-)